MEPRVNKDMIQLQKAAFYNAFSAMSMFQDQAESATRMILEMGMLSDEGKKMIIEWVHAFKKGREGFKKAMDENYKNMEEALAKTDGGRA